MRTKSKFKLNLNKPSHNKMAAAIIAGVAWTGDFDFLLDDDSNLRDFLTKEFKVPEGQVGDTMETFIKVNEKLFYRQDLLRVYTPKFKHHGTKIITRRNPKPSF